MWQAVINDVVAVVVILTYVGMFGCAVCTGWMIRNGHMAWRKWRRK